jgi:hypothetical protein
MISISIILLISLTLYLIYEHISIENMRIELILVAYSHYL